MIMKRLNGYFDKETKIIANKRGTYAVSRESVLMLVYAWNSAPILLTDINRAMVVTGRNFSFPINFSAEKAVWLTGSRHWADSFAARQAQLLLHSREIASLIINETRAYHRERMNDLRPDPKVYEVGDKVFARRSVQSDHKRGRVDKAQYAHTTSES